MKKRLVLSLFLLGAMAGAAILTGCNKTTGGGSFIADSTSFTTISNSIVYLQGDRCTFGFNAQPTSQPFDDGGLQAKGNFQFVDHTIGTNVHGDFSVTWAQPGTDSTQFGGVCVVSNGGTHVFEATFTSGGPHQPDLVEFEIFDASSIAEVVQNGLGNPWCLYSGVLVGGNIVVHK
jgi:hypothetical protein